MAPIRPIPFFFPNVAESRYLPTGCEYRPNGYAMVWHWPWKALPPGIENISPKGLPFPIGSDRLIAVLWQFRNECERAANGSPPQLQMYLVETQLWDGFEVTEKAQDKAQALLFFKGRLQDETSYRVKITQGYGTFPILLPGMPYFRADVVCFNREQVADAMGRCP